MALKKHAGREQVAVVFTKHVGGMSRDARQVVHDGSECGRAGPLDRGHRLDVVLLLQAPAVGVGAAAENAQGSGLYTVENPLLSGGAAQPDDVADWSGSMTLFFLV